MLIFGAGEFAEVAHFYFEQQGRRVSAFTGDDLDGSFCGKPIIPWSEAKSSEIFIAIGYSDQNRNRDKKLEEAKTRGFIPVSFVSSAAICLSREFEEHVFILEANVIQPFVRIGSNTILWSGNHVGHHSRIGRNCFISSHCVICGGVNIGDNTFLGVNCSITDHISVGYGNIIAAGSVVNKSTPDDSVWRGDSMSKVAASSIKL